MSLGYINELPMHIIPRANSGECGLLETKQLTITTNGIKDLQPDPGYDGFSSLTLNIDVQPPLQQKTITVPLGITTEVYPDSGYYGLSKTTIVTPSISLETKNKSITSNGNYSYEPSAQFDGIGRLNLSVQVPTSEGGSSHYIKPRIMAKTFIHCDSSNDDSDIMVTFKERSIITTFSLQNPPWSTYSYNIGDRFEIDEIPITHGSYTIQFFVWNKGFSNGIKLNNFKNTNLITNYNYVSPEITEISLETANTNVYFPYDSRIRQELQSLIQYFVSKYYPNWTRQYYKITTNFYYVDDDRATIFNEDEYERPSERTELNKNIDYGIHQHILYYANNQIYLYKPDIV